MSGNPCSPNRSPCKNRSNTVLVERSTFFGRVRQVVVGVLVRVHRSSLEEWDGHVQHARVACPENVATRDEWQPEIVVRTVRAHASTRRGMPPMLHVSIGKLTARAAEQVLTHQPGLGMHERHHVLQLVAEAKSTSRLIISTARPQTARERLVEEPAVGEDVDRRIRSLHVHGAERVLPILPNRLDCAARRGSSEKAAHEATGVVGVSADAQLKGELAFFAVRQLEANLHGATGIQCGAHSARKARPRHCRRIPHRAVATQELPAVSRHGPGGSVDDEEGHSAGELRAACVARKECPAGRVDLRDHVHARLGPQNLPRPTPRTQSPRVDAVAPKHCAPSVLQTSLVHPTPHRPAVQRQSRLRCARTRCTQNRDG